MKYVHEHELPIHGNALTLHHNIFLHRPHKYNLPLGRISNHFFMMAN
uniref:Uncharacterized protein n=1 Tax=Lepeophtheirus salmonis TaxID=72036 RepID=A0A0K2VDV7_LEPSM